MNKSKNSNFEVGIIGAGAITTTLHLPLLSAINYTQPKYIADVYNPIELAKTYKIKSYNIKNLEKLPDCDIILIATPVGVREDYIKEFSKRGIPIFTEKPFAVNLDEHKKLLNYSDAIGCNYMKIWYNTSRSFENILSSNIFGRLKKISIKEGGIVGKTNRGSTTYQANKKLSGGGVIMESSCHTLSVLSNIFENISVHSSEIIWEKDLDVEAKITFKEKKGLEIPIEYMITLIQPVETGTTLYYDDCYITFNHTIPNSDFKVHSYNNSKTFKIMNESILANSPQQAYYLTWKNFIDKIKTGKTLDTSKLTSIKTTGLISQIYDLGNKK